MAKKKKQYVSPREGYKKVPVRRETTEEKEQRQVSVENYYGKPLTVTQIASRF